MVRLAAGLELGGYMQMLGGELLVRPCSDLPIFQWSFLSWDLFKEEETMVFEAHSM